MKKFSFDSKWFVLLQTLIVLGLGASVSWYFANSVFDYEKTALVSRAANVAAMVDPSTVESLTGTSADLGTPDYDYLKKKMVALKAANSDARFVYLQGYRHDLNKLFFFVDSESPQDAANYSPPGQVYDESSELEINNFLNGVSFAEGPYRDSWGEWVSAYAPIYSDKTGLPIAIVGIDVDASRIIRDIAYAAGFPFLLSVCLAILLYAFHRMRRREKMSELENVKLEFTSFMSHEIRGFVTKAKAGMRVIENEELGALTEEQKAFLHDLSKQADDFGDLVEEFLDIGKIEEDSEIALSKADSNLIDILKGIMGDLHESIEKKGIIMIYEENMPEKIYANCDSNKIARVLSNVIMNAIKYSPEKGTIRLGYIDADTAHTIYIKDEGIGIPEAEKGKIFGKFFRASNARDTHSAGTGLGLYFSKLITEKHGGKIWFESSEGRGATFFISLPKN